MFVVIQQVLGKLVKKINSFLYIISVPPTIDKDNFEKYTGVIRGRTTVLNCPALGLPPPNILWYKDGSPLVLDSRMELMTGGLQLKIVNTTIEDTGAFKCRAVNPAGEDSVEMDLEVMGEVN